MNNFKKLTIITLLILMIITPLSGCSLNGDLSSGEVLYVYNCGDYIDEDILTQFESETGIKVVYDTYETNEIMYQTIKGGGAKYDLIFPSDYMIQKMIEEDMLEKINYENIPNISNIGEQFRGLPYDPTNEYSVPYMWGTVGIIYNKKMVNKPVDSWNILWDPEYKDNVFMLDSIRDTIAVSQKRLGYSLNTTNVDELNNVKEDLIEQRKLTEPKYVVDEVKDRMVNEEAALAVVWSGDAITMMDRNENLEYVIPKEGTNKWFDAMAIPKGAEHKDLAEQFINYLLEPDIAKQNVDYIGYSTPNMAAYELLDDDVRDNKGAYPPNELLEKCEVFVNLPSKDLQVYDEVWTDIKN